MLTIRFRTRTRIRAALVAALAASGCRGPGSLREAVRPSTPHERYARALRDAGLDATALGRDWIAAGERALRQATPAELPFREAGYFAESEAAAAAYRFPVRRGQRVVVDVESDAAAPLRLFLDLFQPSADTASPPRHLASAEESATRLEAEASRDGVYLLRIQPELLRGGRYTLSVTAAASLAFPVSGRSSSAVGSSFGVARDAGRRQHQGVDIFAPRGTPALAAADGWVRVGTNELGGKVVFLRDERRGVNLYYAHLDTQLVRNGARVRVGDTLGLVGNTGNARGTPPHLHFGVYRRGEGAVDPFPYIHTPRERPPPAADTTTLGRWARIARAGADLRPAPDERSARLAALPRYTAVRVLAATGRWLRVELPDGVSGYVVASRTEPASRPIRTARPAAGAPVRDRPAAVAAVMDSVAAGEAVPVYGQFGQFLYVRVPSGRAGWVAND